MDPVRGSRLLVVYALLCACSDPVAPRILNVNQYLRALLVDTADHQTGQLKGPDLVAALCPFDNFAVDDDSKLQTVDGPYFSFSRWAPQDIAGPCKELLEKYRGLS